MTGRRAALCDAIVVGLPAGSVPRVPSPRVEGGQPCTPQLVRNIPTLPGTRSAEQDRVTVPPVLRVDVVA